MKCQSFPCVAAVFALTLTWGLISSHAADETVLDTATIEAITGRELISLKTIMRWITRERPKIDRVACPWLISRFIDTEAEFIFVPSAEIIEKADVHGVELTHDGEFCSFDGFLNKYKLDEPELRYLALIVRGADTDRHDLTPESGGLFAISLGLSDLHPGHDQAVLRDGFIVYDALYRWLKFCRGEKHLWFPPASKPATAN